MKKIGILAFLSITWCAEVMGQPEGGDQKISKKQQRKEARAEKLVEIEQMVHDRSLILQATSLQNRYGARSFTLDNNNYILIDGERFVLQTSNPLYAGLNGVGGVTAVGSISTFEVIQDEKRKAISVIAQVNTPTLGQGTLTLQLNGSDFERATFSSVWGVVVTFIGPVSTLEDALVFEGFDRFGI
ncbi:MAG: DUF4251 domain-containing protein [Bacteroidota bacterium]